MIMSAAAGYIFFLFVSVFAANVAANEGDFFGEIRKDDLEGIKSKWDEKELVKLLSAEREVETLNTGVHVAIQEELFEIAQYFIDVFKEEDSETFLTVANAQNSDGQTLLHVAAEAKLHDIVDTLIDRGADWNVRDKKKGWYAIHYAVPLTDENPEELETLFALLKENIPEDVEDPASLTIEDYKKMNPHMEQVHHVTSDTQETALHMLARTHNVDAFEAFTEVVNELNVDGETALHISSRMAKQINDALELMELGTDITIQNKQGKTAKECAMENPKLTEFLDLYDDYVEGVPDRSDEEYRKIKQRIGLPLDDDEEEGEEEEGEEPDQRDEL